MKTKNKKENIDWEVKKLGEVCGIVNGGTPKTAIKKYWNGDILWMTPKDMGKLINIYANDTLKKITQLGLDNSSAKLIPEESVILSTRAPIGHLLINKKEMSFNQGCKGLVSSELLDNKYLYYFLKNSVELLNTLGSGSTFKELSSTKLKEVEISYPKSLDEQKRIVGILDGAFLDIERARGIAERNLKNIKELFESYLQNIFANGGDDWEEKTLGDLGRVYMCKRILKKQTAPTGDIPFYKIGTFGKTPNAFIAKEIYEEFRSKYSFPKKGDILLSASGTIGRRVVYDGKPAYFQDSNIVWIDNSGKEVLNEYLYEFYGFCDWNPSKGATISRLYNDDLRRIKISYPKSKEEQKEIVEKLDALSEKVAEGEVIFRRKITVLDELKKSILKKAFNGEL